jgi:ribonuclease Y
MLNSILIVVAGLIIGLAIGVFIQRKRQHTVVSQNEAEAQRRADRIIEEAEVDSGNLIKKAELKGQEVLLTAKESADKIAHEKRKELGQTEERLEKRDSSLTKRGNGLDSREEDLSKREEKIQRRRQGLDDRERGLDTRKSDLLLKLEEVANLSRNDAKQQLINTITESAKLEAAKTIRTIEETALSEADKRAKKVLSVAIQRYAGEFVTERCVSVVSLPSDEMKGRIIGREGRNIRALEAATGIDLIVDDTPEAVVISGFDPVRRQIARISLERLIADGRIHPSRIEEVVNNTKKELNKIMKESGEQAAFELGLTGLHPDIIKTIGRLRYRTSYGQNMWSHSIEVGFLCGLMASELGLNVKLARRCGLLHDIGKAMDHDQEGSHAIIGASFCKKYGEKDVVINAIAAHHEEVKPTSVFSHLVMAGDALSGARPGARREILESYIKRLEDLERISKSFKGVSECYAIQAGREIRVMVEQEKVSDDEALILSRDIAQKIEEELVYPGQIRITVIRETRAVEYAR